MSIRFSRWGHIALLASLFFALHGAVASAAPPDPPPPRYRIDLLTIGPGDSLPTRGGHAALVACELLSEGREVCTVYNYGDAPFEESGIEFRFVFGHVRGFLSVVGDVYDATEHYGLHQDRDVWLQALALNDNQARLVAERLQWQADPANREYDFHHLHATCTTGIRDLLDEATGGQLKAQLSGQSDGATVRHYQQQVFDNKLLVTVLSDAAFGRLHDAPVDKYFGLLMPWNQRAYLQDVMVADPAGGETKVPLAGPPQVLAQRGGRPPISGRSRFTWYLGGIGCSLTLLFALVLRRRDGDTPSRLAGLWLVAWALPMGILGAVIVAFSMASTVPELHDNELVVSILVSDLALLAPASAWLRGKPRVPRWLRHYATARLVVVGLAVAARAAGLFIQQPWILPVASLVCGFSLWWMLRAAPKAQD